MTTIKNDEENAHFNTLEYVNRNDGNYRFVIKWKPPAISDGEAEGMIVQKVELIDTLGIIGNYYGAYYEAWRVTNGITDNEDYDDSFDHEADGFTDGWVSEGTIGKVGRVEYHTKVFWISAKDPLCAQIKEWKPHTVSMANDLPAVFVNDFPHLDGYTPVLERLFIHNVANKAE